MAKNFKKDPNVRTRKPEPVYFRKHFPTFTEAIIELSKVDEAVAKIIGGVETPADAIARIVEDFSGFIPDILANQNLYVNLDVTSNKLTYRIDKVLAFGWLIKYKVDFSDEGNKAVIEDVSAQVIVYNNDKDLILDLTDDGWDKVVYNCNK